MPDKSEKNAKETPRPVKPHPGPMASASTAWLFIALAVVAIFIFFSWGRDSQSEISYGYFRSQLEVDRNIASAEVQGDMLYGEFKVPPLDPDDRPRAIGTTPLTSARRLRRLRPTLRVPPGAGGAAVRTAPSRTDRA